MPQFLLMIKKRKWDRLNLDWTKPPQIQADPLGDLRIDEGNLSVWVIEDDKSNLDLVIAALAIMRSDIIPFEYALFDSGTIREVNIEMKETVGNTILSQANHWHRDLIELTAHKVVRLVEEVFYHLELVRVNDEKVEELIRKFIKEGFINKDRLPKNIKQKLTDK